MSTKVNEEVEAEIDISEVLERKLVVFNDDYNTFQHVIVTLIKVCQHSVQQAEQCASIIHNNGKCTVKTGEYDKLIPYKEAICEEGIDARIQ